MASFGYTLLCEQHSPRDLVRRPVRAEEAGFDSYRGRHVTVEDARIYDLPDEAPKVFTGASGPESARLAAEVADGMVAVEPLPGLVEAFTDAGGDPASTWGQTPLSWGPDVEAHAAGLGQYVDAGYQRVAVVDPGEDEEGFFRFWSEELAPSLA